MNYTELLNELISSSKLTQKQIAEGCKQLGEDVTPSYINVLKNNVGRIPSDEVSRAIAKTCNAPFEDILVVQGYLDKAPDAILDFARSYMHLIKNVMLAALSTPNAEQYGIDTNEITPDALEAVFTDDNLAMFICQNNVSAENISVELLANSMNFVQTNRALTSEIKEFKTSSDGKYLLVPIEANSNIRVLSEEDAKSFFK